MQDCLKHDISLHEEESKYSGNSSEVVVNPSLAQYRKRFILACRGNRTECHMRDSNSNNIRRCKKSVMGNVDISAPNTLSARNEHASGRMHDISFIETMPSSRAFNLHLHRTSSSKLDSCRIQQTSEYFQAAIHMKSFKSASIRNTPVLNRCLHRRLRR